MRTKTFTQTAIATVIGFLLTLPPADAPAADRISITFYPHNKRMAPAGKPKAARDYLKSFEGFLNETVTIEADSLEVLVPRKKATFRGGVSVRMGGVVMYTTEATALHVGDLSSPETDKPPSGLRKLIQLNVPRGVRIIVEDDRAVAGADAAVLSLRTNTLVLTGRVLLIHRVTIVDGPLLSIDLTTGGYDSGPGRSKTDDKPYPWGPYDRQDLPAAPSKRFSARP
jgi:lipopolysaccharide export system protein LptA